MVEDPVRRALESLDRPLAPDPAFREALFDRLLEESKKSSRASKPGRIAPGWPQLRRVLTIAASLGLAVAVLAIVLVPLKNLIGNRQVAAGLSPDTPFRVTIEGGFPASPSADGPVDFRIRVSYRGPDAWRIDVLGGSAAYQPLINSDVGSPGSFVIWDGKRLMVYDAATDSAVPQPAHASSFSPLNLLGFFDPVSRWNRACSNGPPPTDEIIAGRPVRHYRCTATGSFGDSVDLWADVDTGLVLKLVSQLPGGTGFPPGPVTWYPGEQIEVTSLEYDPAFAPDEFAFPSASQEPTGDNPPPTTLTIGEQPPSLTGTSLQGKAFDLSSLEGKPTVVYLWADWCQPCTGTPLDALDDAYRNRGDLNIVTVGFQVEASSIRSFVGQEGYLFPVVLPDDVAVLVDGWGISAVPTLVVLDSQGRLLGAYSGWNIEIGRQNDMDAILDAVASGEPLPHDRVFTAEQLS